MLDEGNYVNAAAIRSYNHNIYANAFQEGHNYYALRGGMVAGGERGGGMAVHATYSSPELNMQAHPTEQLTSGSGSETLMTTESLGYHWRPPPPYPRTSTSTPDLATQATGTPPTDHGDLVSSQPALSAGSVGGSSGPAHSEHSIEAGTDVSVMAGVQPGIREGGVVGVEEVLVAPNLAHLQVQDADQDDTSSEHSYATFHAKESDESSDDAGKVRRGDSQIHIRMLGPKEAPPQSKTKEVATLKESFRRMMIARSSFRGSQKSYRESGESRPVPDPVNLMPVSEQPLDVSSQQPSHTSTQAIPSELLAQVGIPMPPSDTNAEMQEILEKLGDPPPYPGGNPPVYQGSHERDSPVQDGAKDLSCVVPAPSSVFTSSSHPPGGDEEPEERQSETHSMAESSSEADSGMPQAEEEEEEERGGREEEDPGVDSGSDSDSEKVSSFSHRCVNMF